METKEAKKRITTTIKQCELHGETPHVLARTEKTHGMNLYRCTRCYDESEYFKHPKSV